LKDLTRAFLEKVQNCLIAGELRNILSQKQKARAPNRDKIKARLKILGKESR
jgi:hypothetical protein